METGINPLLSVPLFPTFVQLSRLLHRALSLALAAVILTLCARSLATVAIFLLETRLLVVCQLEAGTLLLPLVSSLKTTALLFPFLLLSLALSLALSATLSAHFAHFLVALVLERATQTHCFAKLAIKSLVLGTTQLLLAFCSVTFAPL